MALASADAVFAAAQRLLKRPHESISLASEVLEAPPERVQEQPESNRVQATVASRRYLAVVRNTQSSDEEAAIVVFRRPQSPIIVRVVPIYADFQLSISQKKANHSPVSARERSRFCITFAPAPGSDASYTIVTEDISPLADLIAEIKRLHALAKLHAYAPGTSHAWLERYPEESTSRLDGLDEGTLARFNSISSAFSMRSGSVRAAPPTSLRMGLSSIDWGSSDTDVGGARAEDIANDERGRWIVQQLQQREATFTKREEIKVFVGTFNVTDQLPGSTDLSPWLTGTDGAELLVFGFQEFDLTTEAMVRYSPYREDQWRIAIEAGLGERSELYEKLHSRQLVGALILIYVLKSSSHHVSSVSSNSIATGILGLMANKGATAIRLRYKDSVLTFVNSHLAAFTSQTEKRNQEFRDIGRGMSFPYEEPNKGKDPWTPNLRPEAERPVGALGIFDSHQLIWLGDLNYRVELPRADVMRMTETCEWELLLRFDQLKIQQQVGLAWTDFEEAPILFAPTYKFDKGTSVYDTSEKQRTPSWTDRILWLSVHDGAVKSLKYTSHPEITLSDHKPVSSVFSLQVLTIIPDERLKVQQEVMSELERYASDQLPDVRILPGPAIQFDDPIQYGRPEVQQIEVKNVGLVIAQWTFVLKPGATTLSEPWLHITPTSGLILPGEKSIVTLTINVDNDTAPDLNFVTDPDALSDLLVLSIEKKDLFLSVAAREYRPTCFANSLTRLAKLGKPIRTATPEELDAVREDTKDEIDYKASVPMEVYRLLGFLAEYGVELEDVFLVSGKAELMADIRECLDTGEEFPLNRLVPRPPAAATFEPEAVERPIIDRFAEVPVDADIGAVPLSPVRSKNPVPPPLPAPELEPTPPRRLSSESSDIPEHVGIHSAADCLILFLESLPEPVVSFAAYPRALRAEAREDAYRVLQSLPTVNANTLLYIIAFLRVLVSHTVDENERAARIDRLAVVFSSVLLRSDPQAIPDSLPPASIPGRRKTFVRHLLSVEDTPPPAAGSS